MDPQIPVSSCFHLVDTNPKRRRPVGLKEVSDLKKCASGSSFREKKRYTKTVSSKDKPSANESDADDDCVKKPKQPRLKKTMRTHIWAPVAKEDESASEDDFVDSTEDVNLVGKSIASSHLFQLLLHLLEDLAVLDINVNNSGQTLSAVILPVLLDALVSFSATSSFKESQLPENEDIILPWTREKGLLVQQQLVRVILTLSGIVATQRNGVRILLSLKVVPGILSSLAYCRSLEESDAMQQTQLEQNVIQDAVCGCLDLFRVVYSNLPFNPSFVRDANAVTELFRRHGGEDYFRYLFTLIDKQQNDNRHTRCESHVNPMKWLCNLIHCLKVVKVDYIHAIKCLKRRHRNCEFGIFFHHHHDIFGAPLGSVLPVNEENSCGQKSIADPSVCQMAKWSCLLLECLKKAQAKSNRLLILCALREEGVCCCLHPPSVVNTIIPLVPVLSPAVRNYALETLNTMLLGQFYGSVEALGLSGVACSQCSSDLQVTSNAPLRTDSGFASCEVGETHEQKSLLRWKSLRLLRQHILSSDESIALSVAKHLITLAIKGNSDIKEELFFGIYLHVLNMKAVDQPVSPSRGEREELTSSGEEVGWVTTVPNSVMLFCVSSLPYVLQVDKVMRLFLEKGGLTCLTQLLDNNQLRVPVMGVFEALIMIDEQAMVTKRAAPAVVNAQQTLEYKGGIVIQTFIDTLAKKTCAITASFQQLQLKGPSSVPQPGMSQLWSKSDETPENNRERRADLLPKVYPARPVTSELCNQEDAIDHVHKCILETLPAIQDMWKTCAKLCMNSETFRACYRNSPCLYIVQETLVLAMGILSELAPAPVPEAYTADQASRKKQQDPSPSLACYFSRLAFIEAVMIVCFSCHTILPLQKV